ncbi:unnamed protein product [Acanthoscelides obtectus]|uniref:Uncharacterized protein n=1 Tax=Acanthoscelides obtectus TaxID=200917 RepID=A0A9P0P693_ACAOB|nr:unnamed protein product [Acanthoscelides obtectus]CAK1675271.1 hypothetical protein AOBTE_LOCUS30103 [Acanthoscelides obtectus]
MQPETRKTEDEKKTRTCFTPRGLSRRLTQRRTTVKVIIRCSTKDRQLR